MLSKVRIAIILVLMVYSPLVAQVTFRPAFPDIGFQFPAEIQNANDGSNRLFVVEQSGRIRVFPNRSNVQPNQVSTFLDITDRVSFSAGQEIGLLGLAFHPNFENNNFYYVYYTTNSPVNNVNVRIVVERFTANGNTTNRNTGRVVYRFDKNQRNSNHNGGKIAFGPDGYLYASVGDGGGGGDPRRNSQNLNNVFGKILRVDVDLDGNNPVSANGQYEIPSDNPFVGRSGLDIIYAYGIRNTWKFAFDNPTGRLWGADVGQNGDRAREEINLIENGGNYGWSRFQDDIVWNNDVPFDNSMEPAVFSYNHSQGDRSITGGYVYRGSGISSTNPDISNKYIYGDFITGRVWALDYNETTGEAGSTLLFRTNGQSISSFGEDERGNLYFSDYAGSGSQLYQLVDGTNQGGTAVNGVGQWESIGAGTNGIVRATAQSSDGTIYHGGTFSRAGNQNANNIAAWNADAGWTRLGAGTNGTVNAVAVANNGNVYIGGAFSSVGSVAANNVAMWNGSQWSALGQGIDGPVATIAIHPNNGQVFFGGAFQRAGNINVRNIARWNGNRWFALGDADNNRNGMNNEARALHFDNNALLYVGGNFDEAGGRTANRIATWNGTRWGTLGQGTSGFVQAIASNNNFVYIGGNFAVAGTQNVNRIARWNRNNNRWQRLGNGLSGAVNSLVLDQTGRVYAGGSFLTASPANNQNFIMNNIARWSNADGWEALGTGNRVGVEVQVTSMLNIGTAEEPALSVAGSFAAAGAVTASNTGIWREGNTMPPSRVVFATLSDNQVVDAGTNVYVRVDVDNTVSITEVNLFANNNFIRRERFVPYEWGGDNRNDPPLRNIAPGTYVLRAVATFSDGTTDEASITIRTNPISGVITGNPVINPAQAKAVLYPNPNQGLVEISLPSGHAIANAELVELSGRVLVHTQVASGQQTIAFDLSNQSKGVYLIKLNGKNGTQVLRSMKQ